MSYSRWGSSSWYTFWCTRSNETYHNAIFEVCSVHSFEARELREDIDACLAKCKAKQPNSSIEELRGYMEQFLEDVFYEYRNVNTRIEDIDFQLIVEKMVHYLRNNHLRVDRKETGGRYRMNTFRTALGIALAETVNEPVFTAVQGSETTPFDELLAVMIEVGVRETERGLEIDGFDGYFNDDA